MTTPNYHGRLGLQQRVLPNYRVPFFEALAAACAGGLGVFAGMPRAGEGITPGDLRVARQFPARNVHLLGGPFYLCQQRGFTQWLDDWNPDALIVEANARYLATGAGVRWMHARGRKVIGWGLGASALSGPLAGLRRARRHQFLSRFDALIAYSKRGVEEYAALGFPPQQIFVAPNAAAPRPAEAPARRAGNAGRATVLFVGRLQRRKRVDRLLRACAAMPEPRPRLVIVGDGPERDTLGALAKAVYPDAQFAGAWHGAELKPYFAEADLFVLPGTGGLAIQEAMANGLPVIVAKGDGTQDDLVRAGNGWQIPSEDETALIETMKQALSDASRLRAMGMESYRIVAEEINLEKMVDAFVEALNVSTFKR
jgi:glycosyltransferase involved in cell wall biosynthesis